jgi:hypothetical protein
MTPRFPQTYPSQTHTVKVCRRAQLPALKVAHMKRKGITEIVSFVKDYDRFQEINRVDP